MNNSLLLSISLLAVQLLYNSLVKSLHTSLVTTTLLTIGSANLLFKNIEVKYRDNRRFPILYSTVFGFVDSVLLLLGFNLLYRASLLFNILYVFLVVNIVFVKIEKPFLLWGTFILFTFLGMSSILLDADRDSSKLFYSINYDSVATYYFIKDTTLSLHNFIVGFLIGRRIVIGLLKYRALGEIYIRPDCLHYANEEEKRLIALTSLENFEFHPVTPYFVRRYYSIGYFISGLLYLLTERTPLILNDYRVYLYIMCVVLCTFSVKIYEYSTFLLLYTVEISLLLLVLSIFIPHKIGVEIFRLSTFELFTGKLYVFILGIFIINLVVYYFRETINKLVVKTFL